MDEKMNKDIEEVIAIVEGIESDEVRAQSIGLEELLHRLVSQQRAKELTREYYRILVDLQNSSSLKDMTVITPRGNFEVLEILYRHGCTPDLVGQDALERTIKKFAGHFGFNVELTRK